MIIILLVKIRKFCKIQFPFKKIIRLFFGFLKILQNIKKSDKFNTHNKYAMMSLIKILSYQIQWKTKIILPF